MGEGLYWSRDGRTAYAEPFEDLDPQDGCLWRDAWDDLVLAIRSNLGSTWHPVGGDFRGHGENIVARNGLHEVWLYEDSYARVHVTFGVRADLDVTDALARSLIDDRAEAFFDALQRTYPLRVRTSAWTSAPRETRRVAA
ncbi:hypothetical protein LX81_03039 [Palleronia aestuarii]|uniref:Uncharacterized protein n=1 Tax=Palleronia aestuarii TaxID=568105 RepID=A0A2W7N2F7_9RHOB|nr:hypothetical protein [Palleronia aestuarii]PZX14240.1 hypothetical protein LX81_03039 [Palleronia aestuarii]